MGKKVVGWKAPCEVVQSGEGAEVAAILGRTSEGIISWSRRQRVILE